MSDIITLNEDSVDNDSVANLVHDTETLKGIEANLAKQFSKQLGSYRDL
ncbi:hypothetical protein [uncultured Microbulbifer sp.]|nr:hypothetical protein [uncultured Microbulbifer sp.]